MNRHHCFLLIVHTILACTFQSAHGQFLYTVSGDEVTIGGYNGPGGDVVIPATIEGLPVTKIRDRAFLNEGLLTTIAIPDSVKSIGRRVFAGCTNLTAIDVNPSNYYYSSVDGVLFNEIQSILVAFPKARAGNYTIPEGVTSFQYGAFWGCVNLTGITIPNSLLSIPPDAFRLCTSLIEIAIHNNVTSIQAEAFYRCVSLRNITIPVSVTYIEEGAFYGCSSLSEISIPNNVTDIEDRVFIGCTSLSAIDVDPLNAHYSSMEGILFNESQTTLEAYPAAREGMYYTIPNSVSSIKYGAFWGCVNLTGITIPNSVALIEEHAFYFCTNLSSVYFEGHAPVIAGYDDIPYNPLYFILSNATNYYLPEAIGWDDFYGGRPTALWLPSMQPQHSRFGLPDDSFGFTISWASDRAVVVEAADDLTLPVWTPVTTNTLLDGVSTFTDADWADHPSRFYRLREQ